MGVGGRGSGSRSENVLPQGQPVLSRRSPPPAPLTCGWARVQGPEEGETLNPSSVNRGSFWLISGDEQSSKSFMKQKMGICGGRV